MGTTTTGLRFPASTDDVNQGSTNIQNLADDVDNLLQNPWTQPQFTASGTQSAPSATPTIVDIAALATVFEAGTWTTTSTAVEVPGDGTYIAMMEVVMPAVATGGAQITLMLNGSLANTVIVPATGLDLGAQVMQIFRLAGGALLGGQVIQNTGATQSLEVAFWVVRLTA